MIISDEMPKRLAVYVFHDADGIVDRYVEVFLRGLKKEVSLLRVVVNGSVKRMNVCTSCLRSGKVQRALPRTHATVEAEA